jgi:endonuclease YncB( thermonuclease family)
MAASRGSLCIYDETNTLVYKQMASSGDYVSTVTLQGNKLTFSVTSENTVVYVTDNDEILTNTKNITVVSTPVGAVTQTVITLPIEPSTVKLATGTSEIDEYSGYIELAQGETKTTAYGAGMNSGGGAVIYYTSGGGGSTLTFKHFFDSGTIGTGTVKFRHYSQQEPSTGETWILDESLQAFGTSSKQFAVNFTFDSVRYTGIKFTFESPLASYLYWTGESSLLVYNYGDVAWAVTSRTIIFDEPVTDTTLLAWLQANGVKQ